MKSWTDEYLGIPFKLDGRDRNGVDCYGLVYLVYKEQLGIELNSFSGIFKDTDPKTMLEIARTMDKDRSNWLSPSKLQEFDMVQLRTGRHAFHVGIYVGNGLMLHTESGIDATIENLKSPLWASRLEWIYRHKAYKCQT